MLRYRDIVDDPPGAIDRACRFLGLTPGTVATIPRDNSRSFIPPGWRPSLLGPLVRAGAWAGQFAPPQAWRRASGPLVARLQSGDHRRPRLTPEQRERLAPAFADDIGLLASLTGQDFSDWLSAEAKGSFDERRPASA